MKMLKEQVWGVVDELVDKPGTANGTYFLKLQSILLPFFVRCGF